MKAEIERLKSDGISFNIKFKVGEIRKIYFVEGNQRFYAMCKCTGVDADGNPSMIGVGEVAEVVDVNS